MHHHSSDALEPGVLLAELNLYRDSHETLLELDQLNAAARPSEDEYQAAALRFTHAEAALTELRNS